MNYLQPAMLWALPAMLIPVALHFLNKMRYKNVDWAAMHFLLKIQKESTRKAKLREILLLAARVFIILALVLAFSRPISGGWLAKAISTTPECVIVLLDRSSSMGARTSVNGVSKLERALTIVKDSAAQHPARRYLLVENVDRQPLELQDISKLASLELTAQTDTEANIPAMFQAAVEYLVHNQIAQSEIWVLSDLQSTNWRVDDPSWKSVFEAITGLGQGTGVYVIDLSMAGAENISTAAISATLRESDGNESGDNSGSIIHDSSTSQLALKISFNTNKQQQHLLPTFLTLNGARSQSEVRLAGQRHTELFRLEYPETKAGWAKCEIPVDLNTGDNAAYFAWPPARGAVATIVGDPASTGTRRIQLASAPGSESKQRSASIVPPQFLDSQLLEHTDLLVWADGTPSFEQGNLIMKWLAAGGVFLTFPPAFEGASGLSGISWNRVESTEKSQAITSWDENDGPLAKTESGANLPLHQLSVLTRQTAVTPPDSHVVATFSDGQSFLTRVQSGKGQLYLAATRVSERWSSLQDGTVLVPMLQRLLMEGLSLRESPSMGIAGEWRSHPDEVWTFETDCIGAEDQLTTRKRNPRTHSGVYRCGNRIIALNRPPTEDSAEVVQPSEVLRLLPSSQTHIFESAIESTSADEASEVWPLLMGLAIALVFSESILSTTKLNLTTRKPIEEATPRVSRLSSAAS
jgi:hypothetical protein